MWKGVAVSKTNNMANRQALYQQFAGGRREDNLGNPAWWTEANKEALIVLRDAPIEIGDTAYRGYAAQKKRGIKTAHQIQRELAEIDNTEAGDRQYPPYKHYSCVTNLQ